MWNTYFDIFKIILRNFKQIKFTNDRWMHFFNYCAKRNKKICEDNADTLTVPIKKKHVRFKTIRPRWKDSSNSIFQPIQVRTQMYILSEGCNGTQIKSASEGKWVLKNLDFCRCQEITLSSYKSLYDAEPPYKISLNFSLRGVVLTRYVNNMDRQTGSFLFALRLF